MARFVTELVLRPLPGERRLWQLLMPLVYESGYVGTITVPAGFVFDGNSLPRILWMISVPTDYMGAGCIHDYLYRVGDDRKVADLVYVEALEVLGAGPVRRQTRYVALRLFGAKAFREGHRQVAASRTVA